MPIIKRGLGQNPEPESEYAGRSSKLQATSDNPLSYATLQGYAFFSFSDHRSSSHGANGWYYIITVRFGTEYIPRRMVLCILIITALILVY